MKNCDTKLSLECVLQCELRAFDPISCWRQIPQKLGLPKSYVLWRRPWCHNLDMKRAQSINHLRSGRDSGSLLSGMLNFLTMDNLTKHKFSDISPLSHYMEGRGGP
jgi:hypothetical protein